MPKTIYQLEATGHKARLEAWGAILSRQTFTSQEKATLHIPEFRKKVTTPLNEHDLDVLADNEHLTIEIRELELVLDTGESLLRSLGSELLSPTD